jgi:hypothetical protein
VDHSLLANVSRLRRTWQVIWLLGLAAVFLAPALQTGYIAEDLGQSIMPRGVSVLQNKTLSDTIQDHIKHTLLNGRFFPLTPALISTVHFVTRDAWTYKLYIVAVGVLDVFLFYLLVGKLSGRRDFACFAACVTVGLIQYRVAIDQSLGFFGQMQLLIAALFLSLIVLQLYLEGRGRGWLAASVGLYLVCALLYEIAYAFVPLHFCLILRTSGGWGRRLRTSMPFLGVVAFCGFETALIRWLHPSVAYWHHTNYDPSAVAKAIAHQTSAALPLSYFLADPLGIFPDHVPWAMLRWLGNGPVALVAFPAFGLSFLCLRSREVTIERAPSGIGRGWLACLGLILVVSPTMMISISPYHRAQLSPGVGWSPVLIQYYGVGLLLSGGVWLGVGATVGGGAGASRKCVAASLLVAMLVGITYRANRDVVRCFNASPGSRLYRTYVVQGGGGRHDERRLLESALGAGLLDEVPERSTVQVANEYPYWYDATYSSFFYAAHAGKAFETVTPSAGAVPKGSPAYRVRDVLVGRDSGYVVLSRVSSIASQPTAPGGLRLFIRHPELFREGTRPAFQIAGTDAAGENVTFDLDSKKPPMIRSGRDWAIYSLEIPERAVSPESLRVVFDPGRSGPMALRGTSLEASPGGDKRRR